ncbi:DUF1648 domain-containing protein [Pseudactinotalea sp.]|uniref:DUF1648 domain-containing protein n=1 Tax=Pseudactinotalea sp. TaxID=1926260 RepID=UPI003B3A6B63
MTIRTRAALLGALLPVVMVTASFALMLSWRERLPDPMALHWGVDGVDRVGSFSSHLLPFAILSASLCLPAIVLALVVRGAARRGMVGMSAGMAAMMAGIGVGTTAIQLDAPDAYAISSPGAAIVVPILAAVAIGVLATWLAGRDAPSPSTEAVPDDAARLPLPEGTSAVWSAPLPSIPVGFPVGVIGLLLAMAIAMGVLTGEWWLLVFPALIGAVFLVATGWRVQVDRSGLTLRSVLGRPRYHVPADEIVRADVTEVNPIKEFGGWGMRVGYNGALGFVSRRGEAFEVERTGDRRVVVTVDRAAQAAALLNTLADRTRRSSPAE